MIKFEFQLFFRLGSPWLQQFSRYYSTPQHVEVGPQRHRDFGHDLESGISLAFFVQIDALPRDANALSQFFLANAATITGRFDLFTELGFPGSFRHVQCI